MVKVVRLVKGGKGWSRLGKVVKIWFHMYELILDPGFRCIPQVRFKT